MMKHLSLIVPASLFIFAATTAQAAIINVTDEALCMHAEITLEYPSGAQKTFSDSFAGSLFSGDQYIEAYDGWLDIPTGHGGLYDHTGTRVNATFSTYETATGKTFRLSPYTNIFPVTQTHLPDPQIMVNSVFGYEAVIEMSMDFFVEGDGADIDLKILNEGTYGPVVFTLDDLTTSTRVAELSSAYKYDPSSVSAVLVDGHHYALRLMASEQNYLEDEEIDVALFFEDAEFVISSVPEPAMSILFAAGLVGLSRVRRMRGRERPEQ
jgi:hypothetical protein